MPATDQLDDLLNAFELEDRISLKLGADRYDQLLAELLGDKTQSAPPMSGGSGILALNGASGAGQSYVMDRVEQLLAERSVELPRIYLLGTRPPRPGEGHQRPYVFVRQTESGYQDIHHQETTYRNKDIYYSYESRPGAANAILVQDMRRARQQWMYLETVIPTLLHMKTTQIGDVPPWGDRLRIVYLATPSGAEWLHRLLNREPAKLGREAYRAAILGRVKSSIDDMELAAEHKVPTVLNRHKQGERAAREILAIWGL